jgi:diguanylate cyclase (GGDEF)-like protein
LQAVALPVGNALLVTGAACLLAGARALDARATSRWLAAAPLAIAAVTVAGAPDRHVWAGDWAYLLLMATLVGGTAVQLWIRRGPRAGLRRATAYVIGVLAAYYLVRWVVLVVAGPAASASGSFFGAQTTTLLCLAVLVGGVFSMTALSTEQQMRELHSRATRDGLTQLLNRGEFERLAPVSLDRMRQSGFSGTLMLADLDHFKSVNDRFGHDAGDRVLRAFADACRSVVRSTDLVARIGGEEFVLLLPGSSPRNAEQVVRDIRARLHDGELPDGLERVTASYGVVVTGTHAPLDRLVAAADQALYRAKAGGRDCLVHHDEDRLDEAAVVALG